MSYRIGQIIVDNTDGSYYNENSNTHINLLSQEAGEIIHPSFAGGGPSYLQHFGVQARPGAKFIIGTEEIIIGRSGTYELDSDLVKITDLGVISKDLFIIDFKY